MLLNLPNVPVEVSAVIRHRLEVVLGIKLLQRRSHFREWHGHFGSNRDRKIREKCGGRNPEKHEPEENFASPLHFLAQLFLSRSLALQALLPRAA